jgi:hypothetical protein
VLSTKLSKLINSEARRAIIVNMDFGQHAQYSNWLQSRASPNSTGIALPAVRAFPKFWAIGRK